MTALSIVNMRQSERYARELESICDSKRAEELGNRAAKLLKAGIIFSTRNLSLDELEKVITRLEKAQPATADGIISLATDMQALKRKEMVYGNEKSAPVSAAGCKASV